MVRADPRVLRAHRLHASASSPPAGSARAKQALEWLVLMKEELGDALAASPTCSASAPAPADRHRAPARALRHRPLLGRAPPPDGRRRRTVMTGRRDLRDHGLRPRARERRGPRWSGSTRHGRTLRPLHRRRVARAGARAPSTVDQPGDRQDAGARSRRRRPTTSTPRSRPRARRIPAWSGARRRTRARATSTRSRARCRSTRACSPCSRRSTTASRSARRATSTSRWSRATSTTTPAGRS